MKVLGDSKKYVLSLLRAIEVDVPCGKILEVDADDIYVKKVHAIDAKNEEYDKLTPFIRCCHCVEEHDIEKELEAMCIECSVDYAKVLKELEKRQERARMKSMADNSEK